MITSRVDPRTADACALVAHAVQHALAGLPDAMPDATVYLGAGSADLVRTADPRPHVVVPLTTTPLLDAISQAQIAQADVLVAMDHAERQRLTRIAPGRPVVVVADADPHGGGVIRTDNPFDAVEVEEFLAMSPHLAAYLPRLELDLRPFDAAPIVDAISEAILLATLDSSR